MFFFPPFHILHWELLFAIYVMASCRIRFGLSASSVSRFTHAALSLAGKHSSNADRVISEFIRGVNSDSCMIQTCKHKLLTGKQVI